MGKENDKCACVTNLFTCSLLAVTAKNLQNANATEYSLLFAPVLVVQTCNAHMPAASNIPDLDHMYQGVALIRFGTIGVEM